VVTAAAATIIVVADAELAAAAIDVMVAAAAAAAVRVNPAAGRTIRRDDPANTPGDKLTIYYAYK